MIVCPPSDFNIFFIPSFFSFWGNFWGLLVPFSTIRVDEEEEEVEEEDEDEEDEEEEEEEDDEDSTREESITAESAKTIGLEG